MTKTTHLQHLRNMAGPLLLMVAVYAVAMGLFVLIFGWARFSSDFIPLDRSFIGPNLCASLVLVVFLMGHNEYVVEERARQRHESHRQALRDAVDEIAHPTEEAEAEIVADAEENWRAEVLSRLDASTPGGLGDLATALHADVPKHL